MGDLDADTRVEPTGPGRYRGNVSPDWALWGPVGGYVASIALRAAGAYTDRPYPASISCHFLRPARIGPVDIEVECLQTTRNAASTAVRLGQRGRPVLTALVWSLTGDVRGPARAMSTPPQVPPPETLDEIVLDSAVASTTAASATATGAFWDNLELRTVPATGTGTDVYSWARFRVRPFFHDPWIDACRELVSIDTAIFPAIARGLDGGRYASLSLDLYTAFHAPPPAEDYLLVAARGTAAGAGLVSGTAQVWSRDGVLTASGGTQLVCRTVGG